MCIMGSLRGWISGAFLGAVLLGGGVLRGQDEVLIYGNSIIQSGVVPYFGDVVEQAGIPRPSVTSFIIGNGTTSNYVANQGLITSSLPTGVTWKAMVVQGGTVETTPNFGNPAAFQANMPTLAGALFAHSPQALFVGHETGADHPDSSRYPSWFPDAATWLSYPQAAYAQAQAAIDAAHPAAPPVRLAKQGTAFAESAGYDLALYANDLHHLTKQGKVLCALLYYTQIYDGRACDLVVDYAVMTPLVIRLQGHGITEEEWDKLAGYADRVLPRADRPYPGSDSDFQLRTAIDASVNNLCPSKTAVAGSILSLEMVSPLGGTQTFSGTIYLQTLTTGQMPAAGGIPGLHLDRPLMTALYTAPNLGNAHFSRSIPPGLSGNTLWLQAFSTAPSASAAYPFTFSDAQTVVIQ